MKTSIIIPTYNRPDDLTKCIESILEQTLPPDEIIVVDDGNLQEHPLRRECEAKGIGYRYFKKDIPGLTASRNAGIGLASGDMLFFLDDDVILFPDYVEQIVAVYREDAECAVGGVGGAIANHKPLNAAHKLRRVIEFVFLVTGIREGRVLPSGFCTNYGMTCFPLKEKTEVDFLSGGVSSFRKEVFRDFAFDTVRFRKYAMGEDKDFTYRVSKKYRLIYQPAARLLHMESPKMSPDNYREGRMFVLYQHLFFDRYVKKGLASRFLFYYALAGYTVTRAIIFALSPGRGTFDRMRGIVSGIGALLSGREIIVE